MDQTRAATLPAAPESFSPAASKVLPSSFAMSCFLWRLPSVASTGFFQESSIFGSFSRQQTTPIASANESPFLRLSWSAFEIRENATRNPPISAAAARRRFSGSSAPEEALFSASSSAAPKLA